MAATKQIMGEAKEQQQQAGVTKQPGSMWELQLCFQEQWHHIETQFKVFSN